MNATGSKNGRPQSAGDGDAFGRPARNGSSRMAINLVFMLGNMTRDPVLRRLPTGTAVVDMGLAVSEHWRNKEGEPTETVTFVDVVAWGRQAEACGKCLQKGSAVFIEGRLQLDEWTDKQGGKRNKIKVRAERVHFLGRTRPRNEETDVDGED